MIGEQVVATIDEALRNKLGAIGYQRADVREDHEYDGDPILKIVIHYKKVGSEVDQLPTFSLARYIKDAIRPFGEQRFPHFQHRFPEDQDFKAA